ncbi:hypothetical protein AB0H30_28075 [Streptomyces pseudogriseolus]|uniref:hypothetical protein n=1 Tax=Streptomyces pseudogriseolus TaxID=36817 RepID=UPI0034964B46
MFGFWFGEQSRARLICWVRAITAERQAAQAGSKHQEHDQAVPEREAGGTWISCFRG